jgi:hypothetical protein
MNFSEALRRIKLGCKPHRLAWRKAGCNDYVKLGPQKNRLCLHAADGSWSVWRQVPEEDVMADDWVDPQE